MEIQDDIAQPSNAVQPTQTIPTLPAKPAGRGQRFVDAFVFGSLLVIIALTAIPYGTVEPWWEATFECLIFGLVVLWILKGLVRGEWGIDLVGIALPVVAMACYALLQSIPIRDPGNAWPTISADPYSTRMLALKLVALVSAGLLLARFTSSRRRLRTLIFVVILIAVAIAIFGIVRETTQHTSPGFALPQLKPGSGYGQFINRNHFAFLMEMALGLSLGMLVGKSERRARLLYLAAALPIVIGLILANSRGGILSLFAQVLFLLLMYGVFGGVKDDKERGYGVGARIRYVAGKLPVRLFLIACLLGAMIVGVLWIGGEPLTKRLETIQGEVAGEDADAGEGGHRKEIWRASWKIVKDHPITGIGFGGYWVAITEYYDVPGQKRPYQAHNDYLELLVSGGLIAVAIGLWFFIALLKRVRTTLQTKDAFRRTACIGAVTGLFGIAVHSIVDFGLHITINALVAVVLIVIATVDERVELETEPQRHRGTEKRQKGLQKNK